jgi:hypothetical protein
MFSYYMLSLLRCQPIYKYHMSYYKTVQFKFSDQAWSWLSAFFEPIINEYQKSAPQISALVTFKDHEYQQLVQSSAWLELTTFLQTYQIDDPYPQLFIYKRLPRSRKLVLGNPHIDTTGEGGIAVDVPTRFNILMQGDENTEMVWWNHDRTSSAVTGSTFIRPDGKSIGRLQAVGETLKEKWAAAGEPIARSNSLAKKQDYASFVRTDVLHALNWTGANPRLILSVRSTKPWQF